MNALLPIVASYALFVVGWVLYLAIMNLARVKDDLHWFAKMNAYCIVLPIGYVVDMVMNLIICAVMLRIPRDWLLTGTLKRAQRMEPSGSWRETFAAWMCAHLLNQFDPKGNHC